MIILIGSLNWSEQEILAMSFFRKTMLLIIAVCRLVVGVVIIYSGVMMARGEGLLAGSQFDSVLTGLFVAFLGLSCVLAAIVPSWFRTGEK